MLNSKALAYINCVTLNLIRRYNLSESKAKDAIKKSYLYEVLQLDPEIVLHDSIDVSADMVYFEIFGDIRE